VLHIHHLASKIPKYRLRACFEAFPELQCAKRVTVWGSLKSVRLTLWDDAAEKLVSSAMLRALGASETAFSVARLCQLDPLQCGGLASRPSSAWRCIVPGWPPDVASVGKPHVVRPPPQR
jgi:hypothetical protein